MKTPIYILALLFFVLPLLSEAQQDSIVLNKKATEFKNQIDLDVQFLGVDFLYKHRIGEKLFLGGGIGGGFLPKGYLIQDKGAMDVVRAKLTFTYQLYNRFEFYGGGSFSPISFVDSDEIGISYGILMGLFYRVGSIYIGVEPSIVITNKESGGVATSLLIIKIPLKKW